MEDLGNTDMRKLTVTAVSRRYATPIVIARGPIHDADGILVELMDASGNRGRGEACGVTYAGEDSAAMINQIEKVRAAIEGGAGRLDLLSLMPASGARLAVDAALWDLEAKATGVDPFSASNVDPARVVSAVTISMGDTATVAAAAARYALWPVLKVKVDARDPLSAIDAAHRAAPSAKLIVDPNQSWTIDQLKALCPVLGDYGVVLLEQPVAVGDEPGLDGYTSPIPLCADELVNHIGDLDLAAGRFSFINIKLEKAGGLTAALQLADAALERGFGLMVGCMGGSSLAMAPGMVLAQRCDFADLDGPIGLSSDIENGFSYDCGVVAHPHNPLLWG